MPLGSLRSPTLNLFAIARLPTLMTIMIISNARFGARSLGARAMTGAPDGPGA
jgi:hypothetical protein